MRYDRRGRLLPPDVPLGEPVRRFEDTFSVFEVLAKHFGLKLNEKPARLVAATHPDHGRVPGEAIGSDF